MQARNKPDEAPKKPESAPFFLPTMEAQEMRLLGDAAQDALAAAAGVQEPSAESAGVAASQLKRLSEPAQQRVAQSPLLRLLVQDLRGGGEFTDALQWLQAASPVLVERELACVDAVPPCEPVRCCRTGPPCALFDVFGAPAMLRCRARAGVWPAQRAQHGRLCHGLDTCGDVARCDARCRMHPATWLGAPWQCNVSGALVGSCGSQVKTGQVQTGQVLAALPGSRQAVCRGCSGHSGCCSAWPALRRG